MSNLPFYENREKDLSNEDVQIAVESITNINPDIIFVIDESGDPHGTHGIISEITKKAIKKINFSGIVLGYQVWVNEYCSPECAITLFFDEDLMSAKADLISFHKSQVLDAAFPCKEGNFITMARRMDGGMAKKFKSSLPFLECYKAFK